MNKKILILEDIPSDVELAKRELNTVLKNYTVKVMDTEEEFINALKNFKPDLILSDYMMPTFNGLAALKMCREIAPFTPFIIITGSMNEDTAVECMKAGADDYVIKEHIKRLGLAVLNAFEKKKLEKEKRKAEEELRKSEEKYRSIVETTSDTIIITDLKGNVTYLSPAFEKYTGYSRDYLLGQHFVKILAPEYIESTIDKYKKGIDGEKISLYEIEIFHKDGRKIPVELNATSLYDSDKKIVGRLAVIRDISERKRAEKVQLILYNIAKAVSITNDLDELFRTIHESISHIIDAKNFYIALYDEEKKVISFPFYIDEKDIKLKPVPKNLSKGLTDYVFKTGKPLLAPKEFYMNLAKEGKIEISGTLSEVWLGIPLRVKEKVIGVMALQSYKDASIYSEKDIKTLESISYQIASAIEYKRKEQMNLRLSEIIRNTPDGIVLTDTKSHTIYINPAFEAMSGFKQDDFFDRNPADLIVAEDKEAFSKEILSSVRKNGEWRGEMLCIRKNKDIYPIETQVFGIYNSKNKLVEIAAIQQDITERKKAEKQIKKDLEEKRTLLKELYHRTKNNMQVISSMIRVQSRRTNDAFIKDIFTELNNKISAMSLVHQKLYEAQDLSRINLKEYISDLLGQLMEVYEIKHESTLIKSDLNNIFVLIDVAIPLSMVLNELISNIFKHAFVKPQNREITIRLFKDEENSINIYLGDNGIGLPSDMDLKNLDSMGVQTVFSLVKRQLRGEITYKVENGLKWHIKFKDNLYNIRV